MEQENPNQIQTPIKITKKILKGKQDGLQNSQNRQVYFRRQKKKRKNILVKQDKLEQIEMEFSLSKGEEEQNNLDSYPKKQCDMYEKLLDNIQNSPIMNPWQSQIQIPQHKCGKTLYSLNNTNNSLNKKKEKQFSYHEQINISDINCSYSQNQIDDQIVNDDNQNEILQNSQMEEQEEEEQDQEQLEQQQISKDLQVLLDFNTQATLGEEDEQDGNSQEDEEEAACFSQGEIQGYYCQEEDQDDLKEILDIIDNDNVQVMNRKQSQQIIQQQQNQQTQQILDYMIRQQQQSQQILQTDKILIQQQQTQTQQQSQAQQQIANIASLKNQLINYQQQQQQSTSQICKQICQFNNQCYNCANCIQLIQQKHSNPNSLQNSFNVNNKKYSFNGDFNLSQMGQEFQEFQI